MANTKTVLEREREMLSIALQELKPQLDKTDKNGIARKLDKSPRLIDLYLNGYVGDPATARQIIKSGRKFIITREQKLEQHKNAA